MTTFTARSLLIRILAILSLLVLDPYSMVGLNYRGSGYWLKVTSLVRSKFFAQYIYVYLSALHYYLPYSGN